VRSTATAAPYAFSWDATPEAAGPHTVLVRVVGKDGRSVSSPPVSVTVAATPAALNG
jgi:hypothetical protein